MSSSDLSPWVDDGPIAYRVRGNDIQTVEFLLKPGDRVVGQPNTFVCATQGVKELHVTFGKRLMDPVLRRWSGEAPVLQEIVCTDLPARLVMGAPQIGRIVRIPLRGGRSVICQRGSFVASTGSVDISIALTRRLRAGLFGGQGIVFQRLTGDGDVFLHAAGNLIDWVLPPETLIRVKTDNILAFDESVGYDVQLSGGLLTLLAGSQAAFLSQLEGPGRILVQSMDVAHPPRRRSATQASPTAIPSNV